jgi:hypothetical protein
MFADRPFAPFPALLLALAVLFAGARHAAAEALSVPLSETRPVTLGGSATDVLIGDAAIADVTVIDHHHLLVHGKAFGRTNLVVMDAAGRTVFSSPIVVDAGDEGHVSVYRGAQQSDYSCSSRCERVSGAASANPAGAPSGPAAPITAPLTQALSNPQQ